MPKPDHLSTAATKNVFKQVCYRWEDQKKVRAVGTYPQIQGSADAAPAKVPELWKLGRCSPWSAWSCWRSRSFVQTNLYKGWKQDSSDKTKPFPVEWLLEEWGNLAQREALLQFYCCGVKVKLWVQGTHAAALFSTLTSLFCYERQRRSTSCSAAKGRHPLQGVWLDFNSICCPKPCICL